MYTILKKLYRWTANQACEDIVALYVKNKFCIIDYLYFSPLASHGLLNNYTNNDIDFSKFKDAILDDYKKFWKKTISHSYGKSLLESDFLLPDGIALQLFYLLVNKQKINNLNWTDFCPYFLSYLKDKYWKSKVNIMLYGTYVDLLLKTKDYLEKRW
jgi:hypothetical protein